MTHCPRTPAAMLLKLVGLSTLTTVFLCTATPRALAAPFAYVANQGSATVSVIDVATNFVVATITLPAGSDPRHVVTSPDGSRLYVASASYPGSIYVVETRANTLLLPAITVGNSPSGIAVSPDGTLVYVTNLFSNTLSVIDTSTRAVVATIGVDAQPTAVCVAPDGSRVYVASSIYGTVTVIDTATRTQVGNLISVQGNPNDLAISPDGSTLYVSNFNSASVSVIATASNTVQATIPVGSFPLGMDTTPDGGRLYVVDHDPASANGSVAVIDTATNTVLTRVTLPAFHTARRVAVTPDGARAYVTINNPQQVIVFDTATNLTVGDPIPMVTFPDDGRTILIPEGIAIASMSAPGELGKFAPSNAATNQPPTLALAWLPGDAATTTYEYCYDTTDNSLCDGTWTTTTATGAVIRGLDVSTTYFWQVRTASGDADTGAWWSFTTAPAPPGAFTKSSPADGATLTVPVTLTWTPATGATSYEYCYYRVGSEPGVGGPCVSVGTSTSATVGGLSVGSTYLWQVSATNAGGTTSANGGGSWSFTTQLLMPGPFGKSGPPNGSRGQPTTLSLGWYASPRATDYEYCIDTVNNAACDGVWVSVGSSASAVVSGLTPGTTYYWQVQAANSAGSADADGATWWAFGTEGVFNPVGIVDVDGDGHQDLVWRHSATGRNAIWSVDGARLVQSRALLPAVVDTNWQIVATADFNRDANPDLVWRNDATGQNVIWYLKGTTFVSQVMLPSVPDVRWRIVAAADFNADAQPDLVWRNDTTGQNVIWYVAGSAFVSQAVLPPISDTRWGIVAAADFNGDAKPDLAWRNDVTGQNVVWYMDGATFVSQALLPPREDTAWHMGPVGDLNRDGRPDIVWRNELTGENAVWYLDGTRLSSQAALPAVSDARWDFAGPRRRRPVVHSDFNRDAQSDVLWRNIATGQSAVWLMNGTALVAAQAIVPSVPDTNWQVAAVEDFNGDSKPDLLWRNAGTGQNVVWHMDGLAFVSQTLLPPVSDAHWEIVAAAHVNGDGNPDIVWRNRSSGQNVVWFMAGTTLLSQAPLPALADANWQIAGAGDLDGDGRPDLVWRNAATGENLAWYMDGTTRVSTSALPAVPDRNWQIGAVADFDGDRQAELVWRNPATGQAVVRFLTGPKANTEAPLPSVSDPNWVIVRDRRIAAAGPNCSFQLNTTSITMSAAGGWGNVIFSASSNDCAWSASSNAAFVALSGTTAGTGGGIVSFNVEPNFGSTRSGTVMVAGATLAISQAGSECVTSISPIVVDNPAEIRTGLLQVTAPSSCTWAAASRSPFLTLSSPTTGTGSGWIRYYVMGNLGTGPRSGTIQAGNATATISQAAPIGGTTLTFISDAGDYIGQGQTQLLEVPTSAFTAVIDGARGHLIVRIEGSDGLTTLWWHLNLSAPAGQQLVPGTYASATRYPFQASTVPGLDFSGCGRGCNELSGQFTVTEAVYGDGGAVERFHATFEQHCEGGGPALRGEIVIR